MTTPTLPGLIDQMITLARDHEPAAAYTILSGLNPILGADWIAGKKVYQFFPVAQTRAIPDSLIVLAPAPDNTRLGALREFHADPTTGLITEPDDPTAHAAPAADADRAAHLARSPRSSIPSGSTAAEAKYAIDLIKAGHTLVVLG